MHLYYTLTVTTNRQVVHYTMSQFAALRAPPDSKSPAPKATGDPAQAAQTASSKAGAGAPGPKGWTSVFQAVGRLLKRKGNVGNGSSDSAEAGAESTPGVTPHAAIQAGARLGESPCGWTLGDRIFSPILLGGLARPEPHRSCFCRNNWRPYLPHVGLELCPFTLPAGPTQASKKNLIAPVAVSGKSFTQDTRGFSPLSDKDRGAASASRASLPPIDASVKLSGNSFSRFSPCVQQLAKDGLQTQPSQSNLSSGPRSQTHGSSLQQAGAGNHLLSSSSPVPAISSRLVPSQTPTAGRPLLTVARTASKGMIPAGSGSNLAGLDSNSGLLSSPTQRRPVAQSPLSLPLSSSATPKCSTGEAPQTLLLRANASEPRAQASSDVRMVPNRSAQDISSVATGHAAPAVRVVPKTLVQTSKADYSEGDC